MADRRIPLDAGAITSALGNADENPAAGFLLFNGPGGTASALDRLAGRHPYPEGSEEAFVLDRLTRPLSSVFDVRETVPGHGLRIRHLIQYDDLDEMWLVDDDGSMHLREGDCCDGRILQFDDFAMPAGALAKLNNAAEDEILDRFAEWYDKREPCPTVAEIRRFIDLVSGAAYLRESRRSSSLFDPIGGDGMPAVSRKTGRNEPCPCGSGRKFKRCCGG